MSSFIKSPAKPAKKTTRRMAGKLGGLATKKKIGKAHYQAIGRLGGKNKRAKK